MTLAMSSDATPNITMDGASESKSPTAECAARERKRKKRKWDNAKGKKERRNTGRM